MTQNEDDRTRTEGQDDDVKIPIDEPEMASEPESAPEPASDCQVEQELDEEAMVEAAIRAGDQAADEDFAADTSRLQAERDELYQRLEESIDEVDAAKQEAKDATERLARLQADWENFRRRMRQEREVEKERAAEKLVLGLLPVLDDMERAVDHARQTGTDSDQFGQFVDGVSQVHDKMVSILAKEGVEVIDPAGEPFDPMAHQAVGREENADEYDETVAQVYQRGYRMGGKVIRSAMVTVTFGGPKRPVEDEADGELEADDSEGQNA